MHPFLWSGWSEGKETPKITNKDNSVKKWIAPCTDLQLTDIENMNAIKTIQNRRFFFENSSRSEGDIWEFPPSLKLTWPSAFTALRTDRYERQQIIFMHAPCPSYRFSGHTTRQSERDLFACYHFVSHAAISVGRLRDRGLHGASEGRKEGDPLRPLFPVIQTWHIGRPNVTCVREVEGYNSNSATPSD